MIKRLKTQPSSNRDLYQRDTAENLWLWRHRQQSADSAARGRRANSMSQVEAARHLNLSPAQFTKLESGDSTLMSADELAAWTQWPGWQHVHESASIAELCFLARRRSGKSIKEIAKAMGISTVSYAKFEGEGDDRVRAYWQSQGYHFPIARRVK
jgi:transcriptional regulator with XRE-family HTH domain